jgi:SDR family mycofactocin-dependent oxidoreductase
VSRVAGKVALVTGAARGQGRSHAVRLATEGADIIALDVPNATFAGVPYDLADRRDLEETVAQIEATGRAVVAAEVDIRDLCALRTAVDDAVARLGRLDIVVANAGIWSYGGGRAHEIDLDTWQDVIDVNLTGTWKTVKAAVPHVINGGRGGSVILISSAAGLKGFQNIAHYVTAKHGIVGLMRALALELAADSIRVNSIHTTNVNTTMVMNDNIFKLFLPGVEKPTLAEFRVASQGVNALPVPWIDADDVSNAVLFLASDESQFITGTTMPVDAGVLAK